MVLKYIRKLLGPRARTEPAALPPLPPLPPLPAVPLPEVVHRPIPRQLIDQDVVKIIRRLTRFGQTAYIVGGGVRDLLLGRTPKDFDIGTSALPQEIKKLFRNCRIIGRRFRLAHIFFRDKIIEVATFRANVPGEEVGGEGDDLLIRSDNVFGNPETDALRRDFTINALFYDTDKENVIDYVGGIADLDAGLLRTIGDPDIRLREDPIRILRALRLAGRLGFRIEEATLRAIRTHRGEIQKAAVPRILEDLLRMLKGSGAEAGFRLMAETGVMEIVLPEVHRSLTGGGAAQEERAEVFWKSLHAIDLATARGTEFSSATLFAAVLAPTLADALPGRRAGRDGGRAGPELNARLAPVEQRLNIPRRDRDRIRQILLAQRRFVEPRGGRRFSPSAFISRPFFPEAFDLFEILCSARGEHREELRRWRDRIAAVAAERGGSQVVGQGRARAAQEGRREEPEGRRTRRRGGRGRRGRAEGAGRGAEEIFPKGVPDRPELSEEDIALVYGTVLAPEPGGGGASGRGASRQEESRAAGREASPDEKDAPEGGRRRRRRRRGGRRHRRPGRGGAPASGDVSGGGGTPPASAG